MKLKNKSGVCIVGAVVILAVAAVVVGTTVDVIDGKYDKKQTEQVEADG